MPLIVGYAQMIDIAVAPAAAFMTVRRVGSIGDWLQLPIVLSAIAVALGYIPIEVENVTTCDCKSAVQQQILCLRGPNVRLFFVGRW